MLRPMIVAAFLVVSVSALLAEAPPPPGPITVHRAEGAIKIDGDLSDPGWKNAAVIDKFYETSPSDNIPAKVRTVAYLTYDDHFFYVGMIMYDPSPRSIRAPYSDRDNISDANDFAGIFLSTSGDKKTAYEFFATPRGTQYDAIK
ncbi:MAG TPA: hypothetical protein VGA10_11380, partial [Thermoanaerobaculia bacterium]